MREKINYIWLILIPIWIVCLLLATHSYAWTYMTPAGIRVTTTEYTIVQFEMYWNGFNYANGKVKDWVELEQYYHWSDIEWDRLDELFYAYKDFYEKQGWSVSSATPGQLFVVIKPWDARCVDEETPSLPKEIYDYVNGWGYICCDGWFRLGGSRSTGYTRTIYFHLGDEPGQGISAFNSTAYPHELKHFFQSVAGRRISEN